jgi:hypothetical protein
MLLPTRNAHSECFISSVDFYEKNVGIHYTVLTVRRKMLSIRAESV